MERAASKLMAKHWRWEIDKDRLAWLTFDKQGESANTFSREAMEELGRTLDDIVAQTPRGLIIRSAKDSFIAGADIQEFANFKSAEDALSFTKLGWDTFQKIHDLGFATTAMINGFCMGGGMELSLACRYRVALDDPKTRMAQPEVMVGVIPAWHAMEWLPQLIGPAAAMDMLLTGKTVDAKRAKRMGLVDQAVPLRIFENTARMVTLEAAPRKPLSLLNKLMLGPLKFIVASQARKQVARKARREHYPVPYAILDIWQRYGGNALAVPPSDPSSIPSLITHPTGKNLVRIFFLQERLKGLGKGDFKPRHVHVVGAGVMGGDIAAVCAMRGMSVTLQDTAPERIAPAIKRSAALFKRRLRDERRIRDAMDRLIPDVKGDGARHADVIIEAIFENLEAKRSLFSKLEAMAKPDAVLASNTSSLRLADIATALKDPSRLVGIHFFNPVPLLQLVEIVKSEKANDEFVRKAATFVRQIDKLPLPVKDAPGFLVNRVLGPYMQNAFRMIDEGTKPETIDAAMEAFGMPMGPAELADTVGLDICLAAGKALAKNVSSTADIPEVLAKNVALGHLGKKSGQGIYKWENGKAVKGTADSYPPSLIESLIEPYLHEAQAAVADGVVADADLADAGLIFGTGFAPFRGGPLHYLKNK